MLSVDVALEMLLFALYAICICLRYTHRALSSAVFFYCVYFVQTRQTLANEHCNRRCHLPEVVTTYAVT